MTEFEIVYTAYNYKTNKPIKDSDPYACYLTNITKEETERTTLPGFYYWVEHLKEIKKW